MPPGPPWVGCFVLPCRLVVPPPPPMRSTFDLELLRFFAAWAEPERPDAIGSATGAARNAAARIETNRLRHIIISSQAGMNIKVPYHGCRLSRHSKTGHCAFQIRPLRSETGQSPCHPRSDGRGLSGECMLAGSSDRIYSILTTAEQTNKWWARPLRGLSPPYGLRSRTPPVPIIRGGRSAPRLCGGLRA